MFWAFPLYASFPLRYASWEYAWKKGERYFTWVAGRLDAKELRMNVKKTENYGTTLMNERMYLLSTQDRQARHHRSVKTPLRPRKEMFHLLSTASTEIHYRHDNVTKFPATRPTEARLDRNQHRVAPTFATVVCPLRCEERAKRGRACLALAPTATSASMLLRFSSHQTSV